MGYKAKVSRPNLIRVRRHFLVEGGNRVGQVVADFPEILLQRHLLLGLAHLELSRLKMKS